MIKQFYILTVMVDFTHVIKWQSTILIFYISVNFLVLVLCYNYKRSKLWGKLFEVCGYTGPLLLYSLQLSVNLQLFQNKNLKKYLIVTTDILRDFFPPPISNYQLLHMSLFIFFIHSHYYCCSIDYHNFFPQLLPYLF